MVAPHRVYIWLMLARVWKSPEQLRRLIAEGLGLEFRPLE